MHLLPLHRASWSLTCGPNGLSDDRVHRKSIHHETTPQCDALMWNQVLPPHFHSIFSSTLHIWPLQAETHAADIAPHPRVHAHQNTDPFSPSASGNPRLQPPLARSDRYG